MKTLLILIIVGLITLSGSVYIIGQHEQGLIIEFGNPVGVVNAGEENEAGLHFKKPFFMQTIVKFDKRVLHHNAGARDLIASASEANQAKDSKGDGNTSRIIVDAYAKYRIVDVLKFHQTVRDEYGLASKLDTILEDSLRRVVGRYPLSSLLNEERRVIMDKIENFVNKEMKIFGIKVIDVRIKSAELPAKNYDRVVKRMSAEREKEAREFRAKGDEMAQIVHATADKERVILLSNAERDSQIIRGNGDAKATKIYADAFGRDKDFYEFYRTLEAYKKTISAADSSFVLSPKSKFLKLLD